MNDTPSLQETVERLSGWFTDRFESLEALGRQFVSTLRLDGARHVELGEATRRRMKTHATAYLSEHRVVDGCGVIFARSAIGGESGHLEWWVREDESRFARYSFGVVPGGDRYYDYEHHEWFIRAFHDREPAMVGPYIDYLGVESYVLTLTVPAILDGVRIGAIGADIEMSDLEAELLPELTRHTATLALVGRHGSVFFSNSPDFLSGQYIPEELEGYRRVPLEPATAGVTLLTND